MPAERREQKPFGYPPLHLREGERQKERASGRVRESAYVTTPSPLGAERKRVIYSQPTGSNSVDLQDDLSGQALRHGGLNSLFQVALYPPSSKKCLLYSTHSKM